MKFREPKMTKRTIDYQFYSHKSLKAINVLDMPAEGALDHEVGNPCVNHPSDHYAICVNYEFI